MDSATPDDGPTLAKPDLVEDLRPVPTKSRSSIGVVEVLLDGGQSVKAIGAVYGVEHTVRGPDFEATLFIDVYNQRIKVLDYRAARLEPLVLCIRALCEANGLDKIIAMASHDDWLEFLRFGYVLEAVIRHYHRGDDAFVVSKFRSQDRLTSGALMEEILLVERIMAAPKPDAPTVLPSGYSVDFAVEADIDDLIQLYTSVFESYPSPLMQHSYLSTIFGTESLFVVCRREGKLVAAASAELHQTDLSAELTDCATAPAHRGVGIMSHLLRALERELEARQYICAYTMARARSYGMNAVFYGLGYEFMGRLVNNCDIFGAYEDMNIWARRLGNTPVGSTAGRATT